MRKGFGLGGTPMGGGVQPLKKKGLLNPRTEANYNPISPTPPIGVGGGSTQPALSHGFLKLKKKGTHRVIYSPVFHNQWQKRMHIQLNVEFCEHLLIITHSG